jgi:hypothetical protein
MGIGHNTKSTPLPDIMESSIVPEPNTYAAQFRNRVYRHVLHHRELLGYPKGCSGVPYMFVSNDLSGIFIEFTRLFETHKKNDAISEVKKDMIEVLNLLILSYNDPEPFYHSIDKDVFLAMHTALMALN